MESIGTTQNNLTDEQGQVSAPAEPKDERQGTLEYGIAEVLKSVHCYAPQFRKEVLTASIEQVLEITEPLEKLDGVEQEVRNACDNLLDTKAKAALAVLSELSSMAGFTNVGDFATDILHGAYGKEHMDEARKQFLDDTDLRFLGDVFDLAHCVTESESEIHQQEIAADETTTEEQDVKPDETKDDEPQLIEGPTPITALRNWLSKRTYSEKLMAVLLWQLSNKDYVWADEGYCKKHFGHNLSVEYEQAVVNASQDKKYLSQADPEEIVVTAMTAALLPWRT